MDLLHFIKYLRLFKLRNLLILSFSSICLLVLYKLIPFLQRHYLKREENLFPEEIDLLIQLLTLGIIFVLTNKLLFLLGNTFTHIKKTLHLESDEYNISFSQETTRFKKEWDLQGNTIITTNGLVLTNTNSGILLKRRWFWRGRTWKNFDAKLEVKFDDQLNNINKRFIRDKDNKSKEEDFTYEYNKMLGIVFRAQDFDNYFLLEIWKIKDKIVIRPHVRVDGNWDAPYMNPDANSYKRPVRRNTVSLNLKVKDNDVSLIVNDDKKNSLSWILPSHYEINLRQKPSKEDDLKETNVNKIWFKCREGAFGFRNYGNEIVIIRSLNITPLDAKGKKIKK